LPNERRSGEGTDLTITLPFTCDQGWILTGLTVTSLLWVGVIWTTIHQNPIVVMFVIFAIMSTVAFAWAYAIVKGWNNPFQCRCEK